MYPAKKVTPVAEDKTSLNDEESTVRSAGDEPIEPRSEGKTRPKCIRSQPDHYDPSFGGKSYGASLLNITLNQVDRRSIYSTVVNVLFNQMTATKGLKMFGE